MQKKETPAPLNKPSTRRALIRGIGCATAAIGLTSIGLPSIGRAGRASRAQSGSVAVTSEQRRLKFYNTHTRESLDIAYRSGDQYIPESMTQLYLLLRDHRQNEAMVIDEKLFDRLWRIQKELGSTGTYDVISGYRSPKTNAMLREKSSKVAINSYHMKGRAIDTKLRGFDLENVHKVALSLNGGGVGYYPNSHFIHLDTGPVRNWVS